VIERYLGAPPPVRLSRAALESLAVIAYRGPATRGEIDAIRGVNSDSAVATLLSRNLVAEVGRRETVGRPALLAITPDCLQYLGVTSLEELPGLPASEVSEPTVPAPEVSAPESLSLEGFSPELEAEAAQRATGAADEGVADEAEPEAPAPNVDVTEGDEPHAETLAAAGESEADGPAAEALEATVRDAEREDGAENASHADE
jgi:hypothetical protein